MASSSPSNPAVQHESPSQPDPQNLLHEAFKALKSAQRAAFEEQLAKPRPKFATGGCLCGAVRYRVLFKEGHDFWENSNSCLCTACRKSSGSLLLPFHSVPLSSFQCTSPRAYLGDYSATPGAHRLFCKRCGGFIAFREEGWYGSQKISKNMMFAKEWEEKKGLQAEGTTQQGRTEGTRSQGTDGQEGLGRHGNERTESWAQREEGLAERVQAREQDVAAGLRERVQAQRFIEAEELRKWQDRKTVAGGKRWKDEHCRGEYLELFGDEELKRTAKNLQSGSQKPKGFGKGSAGSAAQAPKQKDKDVVSDDEPPLGSTEFGSTGVNPTPEAAEDDDEGEESDDTATESSPAPQSLPRPTEPTRTTSASAAAQAAARNDNEPDKWNYTYVGEEELEICVGTLDEEFLVGRRYGVPSPGFDYCRTPTEAEPLPRLRRGPDETDETDAPDVGELAISDTASPSGGRPSTPPGTKTEADIHRGTCRSPRTDAAYFSRIGDVIPGTGYGVLVCPGDGKVTWAQNGIRGCTDGWGGRRWKYNTSAGVGWDARFGEGEEYGDGREVGVQGAAEEGEQGR